MFDVKLECEEEARQVLQASLNDQSIRQAVLSLKTLRKDLETSGDDPASVTQQTRSHYYGLQQYNMALGGLASKLSSQASDGLRSALLCCQIFISIEQVRKNYAAMGQHIVRGLRIMHEYRARPYFTKANRLVSPPHDQLPFLDVFIIKLFAAPCKFAERPAAAVLSGATSTGSLVSAHRQPVGYRGFRTIAPNMRTELTRIATATLEFLSKVSQVKSTETAVRLLCGRAVLLDSLESWLADLHIVQTEFGPAGPEPISVSFLRIFHSILRIILLGALDSSPNLDAELRFENDRMQSVANNVCERLRDYTTCSGTSRSKGALHIPLMSMPK